MGHTLCKYLCANFVHRGSTQGTDWRPIAQEVKVVCLSICAYESLSESVPLSALGPDTLGWAVGSERIIVAESQETRLRSTMGPPFDLISSKPFALITFWAPDDYSRHDDVSVGLRTKGSGALWTSSLGCKLEHLSTLARLSSFSTEHGSALESGNEILIIIITIVRS